MGGSVSRHPAAPGAASARAAPGDGRPLGTPLSARGTARAGRGILASGARVVGSLVEGRGPRRAARAAVAFLHDGGCRAAALSCRATGSLGERADLAERAR